MISILFLGNERFMIKFFTTLFSITLISFFLLRIIPGDPVLLLLGDRGGSMETYAKMQEKLGLKEPILKQYFIFLKKITQFDLGNSIISKASVTEEFWSRFPATVELGLFSLFFAILLGIPFGVWAAHKHNQFADYSLMTISLIGYSMPIFWWGPLLIIFFSVNFDLLPVSGRINILYDIKTFTGFYLLDTLLDVQLIKREGFQPFFSALQHLILPSIAMGTIPFAVIARMTRSSVLDVLNEDYIRTAKAKGLDQKTIIFKHALRNALVPIITIVGLLLSSIITGAILTETIFNWPGIGKWIVVSIHARDYPVIQGGVLFIASFIVIINTMIDQFNKIANPKTKS